MISMISNLVVAWLVTIRENLSSLLFLLPNRYWRSLNCAKTNPFLENSSGSVRFWSVDKILSFVSFCWFSEVSYLHIFYDVHLIFWRSSVVLCVRNKLLEAGGGGLLSRRVETRDSGAETRERGPVGGRSCSSTHTTYTSESNRQERSNQRSN